MLKLLAVEIKHLKYLFLTGRLIQLYLAYVAEKSEIDKSERILLVVCHQLIQLVITLAVKRQRTIVLSQEVYGLAHFISREPHLGYAEIQLAYHTPCHSIAVQHGLSRCHGIALEGMSGGMPHVKSLAHPLLHRILKHYVFLYRHTLLQQNGETLQVGVVEIISQQL